jgi:hypothetical protein
MMLQEGMVEREWLANPKQFRAQFASTFRRLRARHSGDPLVQQLFSTSSSGSSPSAAAASKQQQPPRLTTGRRPLPPPSARPAPMAAASRYASDFEEGARIGKVCLAPPCSLNTAY